MKRIILVAILMFLSFVNYAEAPKNNRVKSGSVSGLIIDKNTNEALPYVNIVIRDAEHQILTGGITDDKGKFSIKKLQEERILLRFNI